MPLVPPSKNVSGYGAVPLESGELIDPAFIELSGFSLVGHEHSEYITGSVVRPSDTGDFYPSSNPSGFITGIDTSFFVTSSQTGNYNNEFYPLASNPAGYVTGGVVRPSETGYLYPSTNPSGFVAGSVVRPAETGAFASTGWIDQNYYPRANPSGYSSGGGGGGVSQARVMAISSLRI
jgi:hypothetical protein